MSVRRFLPTAVLASIAAAAAVTGCYGPLQLTPSDHATVLAEQSLEADHPRPPRSLLRLAPLLRERHGPTPARVPGFGVDRDRDGRRLETRLSRRVRRRAERLLGLHAEGIPDQRTRMVSRGRGPLPAGPHRSREPRHEGLLRPRIRLSRRVAREPGLRVRLRRHEFHQRRHPQRERRARLVPPQGTSTPSRNSRRTTPRRSMARSTSTASPSSVIRAEAKRSGTRRPSTGCPGIRTTLPSSSTSTTGSARSSPSRPSTDSTFPRDASCPSKHQLHGLPRVARRRCDELSRLAPL